MVLEMEERFEFEFVFIVLNFKFYCVECVVEGFLIWYLCFGMFMKWIVVLWNVWYVVVYLYFSLVCYW